jgi:hypothetical protein
LITHSFLDWPKELNNCCWREVSLSLSSSLSLSLPLLTFSSGIPTEGLKKADLVKLLGDCPDFKQETSMLEKKSRARGHISLFFPKFHCEYNWCELIWANSKRWCRTKNGDKLPILSKNIPLSFEQIPPEIYLKTYQHCMEEMRLAFLNQENDKSARKLYKSHRPPIGVQNHQYLLINY